MWNQCKVCAKDVLFISCCWYSEEMQRRYVLADHDISPSTPMSIIDWPCQLEKFPNLDLNKLIDSDKESAAGLSRFIVKQHFWGELLEFTRRQCLSMNSTGCSAWGLWSYHLASRKASLQALFDICFGRTFLMAPINCIANKDNEMLFSKLVKTTLTSLRETMSSEADHYSHFTKSEAHEMFNSQSCWLMLFPLLMPRMKRASTESTVQHRH